MLRELCKKNYVCSRTRGGLLHKKKTGNYATVILYVFKVSLNF